MLGTTENQRGGDGGVTPALRVVSIDWDEQQIDGVDVESSTAERQRDDGSIVARDRVTAIVDTLCSGDRGVKSPGVILGSDDRGGAGVKDGSAVLEPDVLAANGNIDRTLPETPLVDALEGDEGVGVELGLVEASECDLAIVQTVGKSRNLVGRDGFADQSILHEALDEGRSTLLRQGRPRCAQDTVEVVVGEYRSFDVSDTKLVLIQS